jgi:hypothetical protein
MKKTILICCCSLVALSAVGQLYFSNVANAMGIQHSYIGILGGGVSFVDFDNDGLDDLTIGPGLGSKAVNPAETHPDNPADAPEAEPFLRARRAISRFASPTACWLLRTNCLLQSLRL